MRLLCPYRTQETGMPVREMRLRLVCPGSHDQTAPRLAVPRYVSRVNSQAKFITVFSGSDRLQIPFAHTLLFVLLSSLLVTGKQQH